MVKLIHFDRDPNFQRGPPRLRVQNDRGPGLYHHRGHGYFAKYTEWLDAKIHKRKTKVDDIKKYETERPHEHDYKTRPTKSFRTPRGYRGQRVTENTLKGWF